MNEILFDRYVNPKLDKTLGNRKVRNKETTAKLIFNMAVKTEQEEC